MKIRFAELMLIFQKIERRHIQFAFALLALILFVLGAGAPDDGGPGFK